MSLLLGRQAQNIEHEAKQAVSGIKLSTRLTLAMVSLVVVTTAVLSFITYRSITQAAVPRALDRLATKAMLCASKLESALNVARQDVMIVRGSTGVVQMGVARATNPLEPVSDMPLRESIAARLLVALAAKPEYSQLRIIGAADGGRELLRVDRRGPGGAPRIVPEAELIQTGVRSTSQSRTFSYLPSSCKRKAVPKVLRFRCCMSAYLCWSLPDNRGGSA
jgi:hypothetical protein